MPKYADRFTGRKWTEDPRGPYFAHGGCTWPTFPAWRLYLSSTTAQGIFSGLNTQGVLLEYLTQLPGDDKHQWIQLSGPPGITYCLAVKEYVHPNSFYTWTFDMGVSGCTVQVHFTIQRGMGACNQDFHLGRRLCPGQPLSGHTGWNFKCFQVEFDKTQPPGGHYPT